MSVKHQALAVASCVKFPRPQGGPNLIPVLIPFENLRPKEYEFQIQTLNLIDQFANTCTDKNRQTDKPKTTSL